MNKTILFILPLFLLLTSCEIPTMCLLGDGIGWNETNEGHGYLKLWNCEEYVETTPQNNTTIYISENILSNITIENNISESIFPTIDLREGNLR